MDMNRSQSLFGQLKKSRLIALLTPRSEDQCLAAYEILNSLEVNLEIALRSPAAIPGIKAVLEKYPGALILAGTVMTGKQAAAAIDAGAAGVVSADYIPAVVDVCVERDIMCIPGGLADAGKQLVHKAEKYGCELEELGEKYPYQWIYKLAPAFSGEMINLDLARFWREPYPDLTVVHAGGIALENLHLAQRKDPPGIFCASALTRHLSEPEAMKSEIQRWKEILQPPKRPEIEVKTRPVSAPAAPAPVSGESQVVTFGEFMVRLSPPVGERLSRARSFDVNLGGAEANAAIALAGFGVNTSYVSVLPPNDLGDNACDTLKMFGVGTKYILRKGSRMGLYYLEHGAGPRPYRVLYDRAHSAFSQIVPGDVDWDQILVEPRWFHWTGITPALGDSVLAVLEEGLIKAKERGITVSMDLNYRKNLWTGEKARVVLSRLMEFTDVLLGYEGDIDDVFGLKPAKPDREGYRELAGRLRQTFGLKKVVITLLESISAWTFNLYACMYDGENFCMGPKIHTQIVDRVGAGDAFVGGWIYSQLSGRSEFDSLSFGTAAASLKCSVKGDFNWIGVGEVDRLAQNGVSGEVMSKRKIVER
jgi:2-dehydro-3-deoxygluconokinase